MERVEKGARPSSPIFPRECHDPRFKLTGKNDALIYRPKQGTFTTLLAGDGKEAGSKAGSILFLPSEHCTPRSPRLTSTFTILVNGRVTFFLSFYFSKKKKKKCSQTERTQSFVTKRSFVLLLVVILNGDSRITPPRCRLIFRRYFHANRYISLLFLFLESSRGISQIRVDQRKFIIIIAIKRSICTTSMRDTRVTCFSWR